jgi:ATP-binding cassette, subfamily C (CFTR/MRP), member 4
LDPFDNYTDNEIWQSIQKVELQGKIYNLEGRLDYPITDNGSNFSVGERQL